MSNYRRGRRFEYEVAKQLRELGWTVWRFAGSKPLDLLALRHDEWRVIECKDHYNLKIEDVEKLVKWCKKLPAIEAIYLVKPLSNGQALVVVTVGAYGIERRVFFDEVFM